MFRTYGYLMSTVSLENWTCFPRGEFVCIAWWLNISVCLLLLLFFFFFFYDSIVYCFSNHLKVKNQQNARTYRKKKHTPWDRKKRKRRRKSENPISGPCSNACRAQEHWKGMRKESASARAREREEEIFATFAYVHKLSQNTHTFLFYLFFSLFVFKIPFFLLYSHRCLHKQYMARFSPLILTIFMTSELHSIHLYHPTSWT